MLDPGGYGAVLITKSMTISGVGEQASILGANTNGITINAGVDDTVTLRHLQINGVGTGLIGIRHLNGGALVVDDVRVFGFETGIEVHNGNATVFNSVFSNNRVVAINGRGGTLTVESSMISNNNIGILATATGTVRLSDNGLYNNRTGMGCGGGTLASTGDNRKAGNAGGIAPICAPTVGITIQ